MSSNIKPCPVCKSPSEVGSQKMGDYKQFDCPRCGPFKITGTALAMLAPRLVTDEDRSRARLSHAIRQLATSLPSNEWPEVNSINIDGLISSALPSIARQTENLLRWIANKLGDDQLGSVEIPDENALVAIIGTIDSGRVDDLLSLTAKEGLINLVPDKSVSISPHGWRLLEATTNQTNTSGAKKTSEREGANTSMESPKIEKAHCNICNGKKNAFVRATYSTHGSDRETSWSDTYDILECCGCNEMVVRHEHWFSEWDSIEGDFFGDARVVPGTKVTYWPPPIKRQKPDWSSKISDSALRQLFDELYLALSSDLVVLSTIGARTLFDRASFLLVGDPPGGFLGKLKALQEKERISRTDYEILQAMTDAGNASAHRGHAPTPSQLKAIVDILENFVERNFVLGDAAAELKQSTPPRPKNKG